MSFRLIRPPRFSPVAAILLLLAGCATRPMATSEASPVPDDRLVSTAFQRPSAGTGQLLVKRDGGLMGSACSTRIFVDGDPVADIRQGEKLQLYVPIGEHIVSAWPNGICGGGMTEVQAKVQADRPVRFRVGYGSNGDFSMSPTAF